MSVRQTEDAVANWLHPEDKIEVREDQGAADRSERQGSAAALERVLGVRVTIKDRNGKGKILLEYKSLEDFDRILEVLNSK